jgi:signal transduction histidine kinase
MAEQHVSNDVLNKELARKEAEVGVLRHASLEINTTLDLDEIYDIVLRTMDELFDFHHSVILLLEASGNTLRVVSSRGYEEQALGGTVKVGTGVIGMVAKRHKLMRVSNLSQQRAYAATIREQMQDAGRADELDEVVPVPGLPDAESQIAIPLIIKETLIGVFSVESAEQKPFTEHDELLVSIVANQAASAIQNAELYGAAEQRRKELAEAHKDLKQLNETLEERVRARTEELEQAIHELRETQAQLVQSGKMASLGMLSAGIAHEVNTPIGAIHSNADIQIRAIDIIRNVMEDPALAAQVREHPRLNRAFKILNDTNEVTREATERVATIIQSLKSFARLDQAELQVLDLHEGIESALTLLHHLIKDQIEVIKNYGTLPAVQYYANQINQVFMSLLTNAVQAIKETGVITITTRHEGAYAVVEIADTGCGIDPKHLESVFDPGFTTKGVGVGLGLGLSIAYRIIEDHHGSIEVQSEPGIGTTVILRFPIKPFESAVSADRE